mmetsp:Transcript_101745/g.270679  ORF Transcript_101745/g.270679 Transcript_101745/m.270679 type:complete len:221 (+) Transcript_101745:628-1290(+)
MPPGSCPSTCLPTPAGSLVSMRWARGSSVQTRFCTMTSAGSWLQDHPCLTSVAEAELCGSGSPLANGWRGVQRWRGCRPSPAWSRWMWRTSGSSLGRRAGAGCRLRCPERAWRQFTSAVTWRRASLSRTTGSWSATSQTHPGQESSAPSALRAPRQGRRAAHMAASSPRRWTRPLCGRAATSAKARRPGWTSRCAARLPWRRRSSCWPSSKGWRWQSRRA